MSYTSAPGAPQSLRAASVSVTNITIQWDRVDCQDRNGPTGGYRVLYYSTSNFNVRGAEIVPGTGNSDRIFNVTGLPPRTNYTFEVQASNAVLDVRGAAAAITVSTSVPQSEFSTCVCVVDVRVAC